ncbi:hypothetical protein L1987_33416 [Smallanthus sonchifolius]|uniref:Uncharacterized protein n=1 Tax=Smallanthus sonchifolius TaxID=185202 RepID=A0ACB9HTJ6_9ASTR|nr:hypothetical protein L1987_33416 [Smallanthus sonchifolius]
MVFPLFQTQLLSISKPGRPEQTGQNGFGSICVFLNKLKLVGSVGAAFLGQRYISSFLSQTLGHQFGCTMTYVNATFTYFHGEIFYGTQRRPLPDAYRLFTEVALRRAWSAGRLHVHEGS